MSESEPDDGKLRDSEVALMDTIKLIFEVFIAKKIVPAGTLDKMLAAQQQNYEGGQMDRAVFILGEFRRVVSDPEREQLRELANRPNEGSA